MVKTAQQQGDELPLVLRRESGKEEAASWGTEQHGAGGSDMGKAKVKALIRVLTPLLVNLRLGTCQFSIQAVK